MESGELEGTASNIENLAGLAPHWLPKNLINILAVHGPKRIARAPDAPTLLELTDNPVHRQDPRGDHAAGRHRARDRGAAGRAGRARRGAAPRARAAPPRTRITWPTSNARKLEVDATSGEETQAAVARLIATSPEVVAMVLDTIK